MRGLIAGLGLGLGLGIMIACSGGSGGDSTPVTSESARAACEKLCERDVRCDGTQPLAACIDECAGMFEGWAREDALADLAACIQPLACDADDDDCADRLGALDAHDDWEAACMTELAGVCPDFSAAACSSGWFRLMIPAVVEELTACLDNATCDAKGACFEGVFERYHIDL